MTLLPHALHCRELACAGQVLRLTPAAAPKLFPCSPPFCRSGGVQQVALGGLEKQGELKGMDEAVFSAAPPEAMRGLLQVGSGTNRAGQRLGKRRLRS